MVKLVCRFIYYFENWKKERVVDFANQGDSEQHMQRELQDFYVRKTIKFNLQKRTRFLSVS